MTASLTHTLYSNITFILTKVLVDLVTIQYSAEQIYLNKQIKMESPTSAEQTEEEPKATSEDVDEQTENATPKEESPGPSNDDPNEDDSEKITPESDIGRLERRICIVTTASLPWRTGTAVNPLARALYLTRGRPRHYVTLVIPWLGNHQEQVKLFGEKWTSFKT